MNSDHHIKKHLEKVRVFGSLYMEQDNIIPQTIKNCEQNMKKTMFIMKKWLETSGREKERISNPVAGQIVQRIRMLQAVLTSEHKLRFRLDLNGLKGIEERLKIMQDLIYKKFRPIYQLLGLKEQNRLEIPLEHHNFLLLQIMNNLHRLFKLQLKKGFLKWDVGTDIMIQIVNSVEQDESLEDHFVRAIKLCLQNMQFPGAKEKFVRTVNVKTIYDMLGILQKTDPNKCIEPTFTMGNIDMDKIRDSIDNKEWKQNKVSNKMGKSTYDAQKIRVLVSNTQSGVERIKQQFELEKFQRLLEQEGSLETAMGEFNDQIQDQHNINMSQEIRSFQEALEKTKVQQFYEAQTNSLKILIAYSIRFIPKPAETITEVMVAGNYDEWGLFVPKSDKFNFITNSKTMKMLTKFQTMIQQSQVKYYVDPQGHSIKKVRNIAEGLMHEAANENKEGLKDLFFRIELKLSLRMYESVKDIVDGKSSIIRLADNGASLEQLINK